MRILVVHLSLCFIWYQSLTAQVQFAAPFGPPGASIAAFACDSSGLFYAGGKGLHVSSDNGVTWATLPYPGPQWEDVRSIATDPDGRIFVVYYWGLFVSTDHGATWAKKVTANLQTVAVDPFGRIFAGGVGGIYTSTNSGTTFSRIPSFYDGNEIYDFLFVGTNGIRMATMSGIFSTTDGGETWTLDDALRYVHGLKRTTRGTYLAATQSGLFERAETTPSWTRIETPFYFLNSVAFTSHAIFCSDRDLGIMRSVDDGVSWEIVNTGLPSTRISGVFTTPAGTLWSSGRLGIQQWNDGDNAWHRPSAGPGFVQMLELTIAPDGEFFASTTDGLFRSADRGVSWSRSDTTLPSGPTQHMTAGTTSADLFAWGDGAYRSTDGGAHWAMLEHGIQQAPISAFSVLPGGVLLASQNGIVLRSSDRGDSWAAATSGDFSQFVSDGNAAVYASGPSGLMHSTDDGATWTSRNTEFTGIKHLVRNAVGHLFASNYLVVSRSVDGGRTWGTIESTQLSVADRSIDVGPNGSLYRAGMDGSLSGVLRCSGDNGTTWTSVGSLPYFGLTREVTTDSLGYIYGVSEYRGIFRSLLPVASEPLPIFQAPVAMDLGRQRITQRADTLVAIANPGNAPLNVSVSLTGDTVFHMAPATFTVPPRSIVQDSLSFTLTALRPYQGQMVYEHSAGTLPVTIDISATGYGIPQLHIGSDTITFPPLAVGNALDTALTFTNTGDDTLQIYSITSSIGSFLWNDAAARPVPPESTGVLIFHYAPRTVGRIMDTAIIHSNTASGVDTFRVLTEGLPLARMEVPGSLAFGVREIFKTHSMDLVIRNTGTDTLRIFDVQCADPVFACPKDTIEIAPGDTGRRSITYSPTQYRRDTSVVVIYSNSATPVVRIHVTGSSEQPYLICAPGYMAGVATLDSFQVVTAWLYNTSVVPAHIDSIVCSRDHLMLDTVIARIAPNGAEKLRIRFAPRTYGSFNDTVWVHSNARPSPLAVPLFLTCPLPGIVVRRYPVLIEPVPLGGSKSIAVTLYAKYSLAPIIIDSVSHTSTYFSSDLVAPLVLDPGDSVTTSVTFTAPAIPGAFGVYQDTLRLHLRTGRSEVFITGNSPQPYVYFTPPLPSSFGSLGFGDSLTARFIIRNLTVNRLDIDSIRSTTAAILPSLQTASIAGNDTIPLTFTVRATRYGTIPDTIRFYSNGNPSLFVQPMMVTVPDPGPRFLPSDIMFGRVKTGSALERNVILINTSLSTLLPDSFRIRTSAFMVSLQDQIGPIRRKDTLRIVIRFFPALLKTYLDSLRIFYNGRVKPFVLPLAGEGSTYTGIAVEHKSGVPSVVGLSPAYPNPFNPTTTIGYGLPERSHVVIRVFNILGEQVARILEGEEDAGYHTVQFDASGLPSGPYIIHFEAEGRLDSKRVLLLR